MKKYLLATFILILYHLSSAQGWVQQNPYPTFNPLWAVDFPSTETGYIGGHYKTLMKTSDGGITWEQLDFPSEFDVFSFSNLHFITDDIGYTGAGSHVFKTTDGGENWESSLVQNWGSIEDLYFIDDTTGFAFGYYELLAKTTDGGATWDNISFDIDIEMKYFEMEFADLQTGYLIGGDWFGDSTVLRKTNDGGFTWEYINIPDEITWAGGLEVFTENDLWVGASNGFYSYDSGYSAKAFHTTDGGITWTSHKLGRSNISRGAIYDISFFNELEGRITGNNFMYVTHDGGATWADHYIDCNANAKAGISWLNDSTCYIAGYDPKLTRTTNSGASYENLVTGVTSNFSATWFNDTLTGFVAGNVDLEPEIKYTHDGGETWQPAVIDTGDEFIPSDMFFSDDTTGWAFGWNGILKSIDGGLSWERRPGEYSLYRSKGAVPADSVMYAAGGNGKVYKSTDEGNSWIEVFAGLDDFCDNVTGLVFPDPNTGYLAVEVSIDHLFGRLMKTADGGQTWTELDFGAPKGITAISFISNETGLICLYDKRFLRTTDGGLSWTPFNIQTESSIPYLRMFNDEEGVAVDGYGHVYRTTDGGINFTQLSSGDYITMYNTHCSFTDPTHGWAAGENSMIMRFDATLTDISSPVLPSVVAAQPFFRPNPAKETITITTPGNWILHVHSINGNRVMTIPVSEGTVVNTANLKKGIYILTLINDKQRIIKKMVKV